MPSGQAIPARPGEWSRRALKIWGNGVISNGNAWQSLAYTSEIHWVPTRERGMALWGPWVEKVICSSCTETDRRDK